MSKEYKDRWNSPLVNPSVIGAIETTDSEEYWQGVQENIIDDYDSEIDEIRVQIQALVDKSGVSIKQIIKDIHNAAFSGEFLDLTDDSKLKLLMKSYKE